MTDDSVYALVEELQRDRRKGVPVVILTGRLGNGAVAAVQRLISTGRLYWSINAARTGGDRYNLVKVVKRPSIMAPDNNTPLW
jgi:hypothetical protein